MQLGFKFKYSVLTLALFSSYASIVNAQVAEEEVEQNPQLSTVVVTANRLPQTINDAIANTTVITRQDIEASGAVDLPTLLLNQAGIEFGRNGGVGQAASIFMRGTLPRDTLVLIDGVAINTQLDGVATLGLVSLELIERIEIVRGNVSAAYGSNAVGGVIQIFTKQGSSNTGVSGEASLTIGTQGQRKVSAGMGFATNNTRFAINAAHTRYDGVSAQNVAQSPDAEPDNDGSKQTVGNVSLNHRVSSTLNVGIQGLSVQQDTQYDGYSLDNRADERLSKVAAFADWAVNPMWKMNVRISEVQQTAHQTKRLNTDSTATAETSNSDSRRQFISVQNTLDFKDLGTVFVAAERELARFAGEFFGLYGSKTPESKRNANAFFAGWQNKLNRLGWNANIRRDNAEDEHVNTYALGVSYDITPEFSVRASQATAFNRPSLGELNDPEYGNPNLKPKDSLNRELGAQWQQGSSLVRVTAFRSKTINQFAFDPVTFQAINIKEASNKGIEVLAETAMPWPAGKLRVGFNSHKPVDETQGKLLDRRAKRQLHAALAGGKGVWTWDTSVNYVGNRADKEWVGNNIFNRTLKSYVKLDASIGYAINKKSHLSLGLNNINKANDQSAYGYSGTPRSAVLRFNHKL